MSANLAFLICWWNDPSIFRTLDSIPKEFAKIVVDGKFKSIQGGAPLSPQEMRDKVVSYDNVTLIDAPNLDEPDKRNISLEASKEFSYALIIDSDEYIRDANWPAFANIISSKPPGIFHVLMEYDKTRLYANPRLIIPPKQWYYYKAHCILKNKLTDKIERTTDNREDFIEDDILVIGHDQKLRSDSREQISIKYEKWQIQQETPIREMYAKGKLT